MNQLIKMLHIMFSLLHRALTVMHLHLYNNITNRTVLFLLIFD